MVASSGTKRKRGRKKEERKSCIVADAQHTCRQMIKFKLPTYLSSNDQIQPLGKFNFRVIPFTYGKRRKKQAEFYPLVVNIFSLSS